MLPVMTLFLSVSSAGVYSGEGHAGFDPRQTGQSDQMQHHYQEQTDQIRNRDEHPVVQVEQEKKAGEAQLVREDGETDTPWYRRIRAGYEKGLFAETEDGNYKVKMNLLGQFQFYAKDIENKPRVTDFEVRRWRVKWAGNAFRPWFMYTIQIGDDSNGFELIDGYITAAVDTQYGNILTPRVGQFKVPFYWETLINATNLQFVDRSIVNTQFGLDRERGAALYGVLGNYVTYGAGVFNGVLRNGHGSDTPLLYAGRIQLTPCCGKLTYNGNNQFPSGGSYDYIPQNFNQRSTPTVVMAAAAWGMSDLNTDEKSPSKAIADRFQQIFAGKGAKPVADILAVTADIHFKYWLLSLHGSYDGRWITPQNAGVDTVFDQGFTVQGGVFLWPGVIEFSASYALILFDTDIRGVKKTYSVTPCISSYFLKDNRWKLQMDYSFIRNEDTDGNRVDQNQFRVQLQVLF